MTTSCHTDKSSIIYAWSCQILKLCIFPYCRHAEAKTISCFSRSSNSNCSEGSGNCFSREEHILSSEMVWFWPKINLILFITLLTIWNYKVYKKNIVICLVVGQNFWTIILVGISVCSMIFNPKEYSFPFYRGGQRAKAHLHAT